MGSGVLLKRIILVAAVGAGGWGRDWKREASKEGAMPSR